jgi:hypothetical protein
MLGREQFVEGGRRLQQDVALRAPLGFPGQGQALGGLSPGGREAPAGVQGHGRHHGDVGFRVRQAEAGNGNVRRLRNAQPGIARVEGDFGQPRAVDALLLLLGPGGVESGVGQIEVAGKGGLEGSGEGERNDRRLRVPGFSAHRQRESRNQQQGPGQEGRPRHCPSPLSDGAILTFLPGFTGKGVLEYHDQYMRWHTPVNMPRRKREISRRCRLPGHSL